MAKNDHRILDRQRRLSYTCENYRYLTDTATGFSHGRGRARGSALRGPLLMHGQYSLWLEHVRDNKTAEGDLFWFMWYKDGIPEIPGSGVFHKEEVKELAKGLIDAL